MASSQKTGQARAFASNEWTAVGMEDCKEWLSQRRADPTLPDDMPTFMEVNAARLGELLPGVSGEFPAKALEAVADWWVAGWNAQLVRGGYCWG